MSLYKQDDLLSVLLALEERIMRKLQVASLAEVVNIDRGALECGVRLVPSNPELEPISLTCKYSQTIDEDLNIGDLVVVLFLNKDSRRQVYLYESNDDTVLQVENTHNEKNAIVINVFRKKV